MAINQITTANTFSQWVEATRALIATANGLTDGVAAGQQFTMNTAVVIDGLGAYLDVKTNASFNAAEANTLNVAGAPLIGFSSILVTGQSDVVANTVRANVRFANGLGVIIQTNAANDTITFSVPQDYAIGYTGSQGTTGFTGSAGTNGTTGFTGSAGTNGFTGSKGDIGFTGSRGTTGFTGSAGTNGTTGFTGSKGDIGFTGSKGDGYLGIPQNAQTATYTVTTGDVGKHISTPANVAVPSSVFAIGDTFSVFNSNTTSKIFLTQGTGTTIRLAGTTLSGNRGIASNGLVSVVCVGTNLFAASGAGLS